MRSTNSKRKSSETNIDIKLNLDGVGISNIDTSIPFFDHMLEGFSKHGAIDLEISAKGDIEIDQHHLLEDLGMIIGKTLKEAIGDKKGINRAGFFAFPMDESLGIVSIDLSGRPYMVYKTEFKRQLAGGLDTDCLKEFFSGFSMGAGCNVSIYVPYGDNDHHKIEAIFKAFGKALKMAVEVNPKLKEYVPSTKGLLDNL